ncbi:MAG: amino acid ABC transporter permease, partial [Pseudomonadota bacterium]
MSGTHAHTVHYVAPTRLPEQAPPKATTGVLGWLRENLFSSWINSALTLLSIAFLLWLLPDIIDWAVFKSVWNASSLRECRDIIADTFGAGTTGACWAVINERFNQLLYGFYPQELQWRPNVAFLLLVAAMVPVLFQTMRPLVLAMGAILVAKIAWALYLFATGHPFGAIFGPTTIAVIALGGLAVVFGETQHRKRWFILTAFYPVIAFFLLWGGLGLQPVETSKFGGFLLTMVIGVTGIAGSLPLG